jgi:hemerythrin-like metal-binding protein
MADWTPDLTLNHDLLDLQHVELFRSLSAAGEAVDGPTAGVEAAVAAVADVLVTHFAAEEAVMDEALYPERTRHRSAHELFMADFLQMRDELRRQGPTPVVADWIRRRIPEWLEFHIRVNDHPLGAYLARHRSQQPTRPAKDRSRRPS